ncbi:MAG TPA: 23S rRNA (pseudouridine(1915)-N(3))-methyltransferase RlmH [Anaeromyxobacter sp.]|nr:23S rRNA (pseudouridine(1915)-N(3))-methyltransferase RlmH [Anaeromyxobacter sp.]
MRLRLIAVGRDRSGLYAPAVEEYAGRLARQARFELVEVPEARKHAGTPRARDEEGEALLAKVGPRDRVVVLDERGEELASVAFAARVGRWIEGAQDVALLMGGSDGLSDAVRARAKETLALSRLTLAHRLARLVLVEQLYRAMTILRGEPYHK